MAKVLIVEDTEVNRIVLSRRLEQLGFEIVLAADGGEAVVKAKEEIPDIILLDLYLPVMDGGEVAKTLKQSELTKQIPIIALTAHAMKKTRDEMVDLGCDEYEMKPVNFERLVSKINQLIGK